MGGEGGGINLNSLEWWGGSPQVVGLIPNHDLRLGHTRGLLSQEHMTGKWEGGGEAHYRGSFPSDIPMFIEKFCC